MFGNIPSFIYSWVYIINQRDVPGQNEFLFIKLPKKISEKITTFPVLEHRFPV